MRISDCSSDVCSSDLLRSDLITSTLSIGEPPRLGVALAWENAVKVRQSRASSQRIEAFLRTSSDLYVPAGPADPPVCAGVDPQDRKRVVKGKSVPVRLDTVGRRTITQQTTNPN